MFAQREFLIERLNRARKELTTVVSQAPINKFIYPNWTIKEYLDHIASWDDAVVEALHALAKDEPAPQTAARGINAYNAQTISTRETLDLEHTKREFAASRQAFIQALRDLPDDKFNQPLTFPWGEFGTVAYLVEIFVEHEEHHTGHLAAWLKNPDKDLDSH